MCGSRNGVGLLWCSSKLPGWSRNTRCRSRFQTSATLFGPVQPVCKHLRSRPWARKPLVVSDNVSRHASLSKNVNECRAFVKRGHLSLHCHFGDRAARRAIPAWPSQFGRAAFPFLTDHGMASVALTGYEGERASLIAESVPIWPCHKPKPAACTTGEPGGPLFVYLFLFSVPPVFSSRPCGHL